LSFGLVKGYEENGQKVMWYTTLGNLFQYAEFHKNEEAFTLPKTWLERKDKIKADTPFNFVCTADIIGGNSGSPVINGRQEIPMIFPLEIQQQEHARLVRAVP
jgi:hypothetical protein